MSTRTRMGTFLALSTALVLLPGCGKQDAMNYLKNTAATNQKLADANRAFQFAIQPALQQQAVDLDNVRSKYKGIQDTVAQAKADSLTWKVPSGTHGQKFHDSYQRYVKLQEEGAQNYGDIVKALEDRGMSADRKAATIQKVLGDFDTRDLLAFRELQNNEQALASEHGIKLVGVPK